MGRLLARRLRSRNCAEFMAGVLPADRSDRGNREHEVLQMEPPLSKPPSRALKLPGRPHHRSAADARTE